MYTDTTELLHLLLDTILQLAARLAGRVGGGTNSQGFCLCCFTFCCHVCLSSQARCPFAPSLLQVAKLCREAIGGFSATLAWGTSDRRVQPGVKVPERDLDGMDGTKSSL